MRLIDADALNPFYRSMLKPYNNGKCLKEYIAVAMNDIEKAPTVDAVPVIRCKDCKHFEYNHVEKVDGITLIVAHEICKRWGDGCKTSENGWCFMAERKEE